MAHFIDDITYISKKYEKNIRESMLPLQQLGITYIAVQNVTNTGYWSIISSNPAWIEYSAGNELYLYDPSLINPEHYNAGICFANSHDHDDFRNIFCKHSEGVWDLGNTLVIIEKNLTECEFTFIATSVKNKKIINTYLARLGYLKKFNRYFKKENATLLKQATKYKVDLKKINPSYFNTDNVIDVASDLNEIHDLNNNPLSNLLSIRERECVMAFLNGNTAKETAATLGISYRTIEEHFTNIKKKLGCKSKREILAYFAANNTD